MIIHLPKLFVRGEVVGLNRHKNAPELTTLVFMRGIDENYYHFRVPHAEYVDIAYHDYLKVYDVCRKYGNDVSFIKSDSHLSY